MIVGGIIMGSTIFIAIPTFWSLRKYSQEAKDNAAQTDGFSMRWSPIYGNAKRGSISDVDFCRQFSTGSHGQEAYPQTPPDPKTPEEKVRDLTLQRPNDLE